MSTRITQAEDGHPPSDRSGELRAHTAMANERSGTDEAAQGALSGVRVLDLATNAVAYTSRLLGDLGAEVIRVEPPGGSALRLAAPQRTVNGSVASCAHAFWNANKKSVTLDLEHADGRKLFGELVARSDIVIETFAPGTLAAWGLGYDEMKRRNPGIILVSVTPYGQSGPRANFRTTDLTLLAAGGLLSLGGYPETGPVAVPGEQGHLASAIFGAVAALKALLEREGTNHGQWVDVSGQECIAFALEDAVPEWYLNRTVRKRTGDKAREAGTGVYPCMDGHVSMVAGRLGTAKAFKTLVHWIADSGTPRGRGTAGRALAGFQVPTERGRDRSLRSDLRHLLRHPKQAGAVPGRSGAPDRNCAG